MQVLVVGGTGTLGRQVARRALDAGHQVRCVVRSPRKAAFLQEWGCELTRGDLLEPDSLDYALEGQDAVIDAATARATDPGSAYEIDWSGIRQALALIGVTELENLGSLIRSAAAFGVDHVLLGPGTADPLARRSLRVSMATALKMRYFRMSDPVTLLRSWREGHGVRTIATTLDASAISLSEIVPDDRPLLLMMGNEAKGLSAEILDAATDRVVIPMQLGTDSLNVAVAGAVFLYELSRR